MDISIISVHIISEKLLSICNFVLLVVYNQCYTVFLRLLVNVQVHSVILVGESDL